MATISHDGTHFSFTKVVSNTFRQFTVFQLCTAYILSRKPKKFLKYSLSAEKEKKIREINFYIKALH